MLTIRQAGDRWQLCRGDTVLSDHATYDEALGVLGAALAAMTGDERAAMATNGVLPEVWASAMCYSRETGDGRDFTACDWSSRDPSTSVLPLMLQTETEFGHFGAQLAGYIESIDNLGQGADPTGRGRFYDSEVGRQFRDMLLEGRRFGVSVDPGAVALEEECLAVDDDGWCEEWKLNFLAYEIIGLTGTPFPGFADAAIWLEGAPAEAGDDDTDEGEEAVAAAGASPGGAPAAAASSHTGTGSCCAACAGAARTGTLVAASAPLAPPREWFDDPQFDRLTALRVTDDGRVLGHLAPWGQCHTGYLNRCVETPHSSTSYAYFRTGYVLTRDGDEVATGPLTIGTGHADRSLSFRGAVDHYDDTGTAIADVACGEDSHGVWVAGALRPGVTDEQVRVLRASALSGDWRPMGRGLELVAALAVNSPGFPIVREENGRVQALVAAGAMAVVAQADPGDDRLRRLEARLAAAESALAAPHRERLRRMRREVAAAKLRASASV